MTNIFSNSGLKVDMETYCPGSKCRKVGLLNLSFEHILADKGYNTSTVINFNALNPMWERTGDFSPFKVVEKKKKLVLKCELVSLSFPECIFFFRWQYSSID